jgi:cell division protein ZapA
METIEVKILGQRYKVKSDEGEEYVSELAKFLNNKIKEVQKSSKAIATHNLVILAALNIADSLFKEKEKEDSVINEVEKRIRRILKRIKTN